jgi:hypothetical protein
VRIEDFVARADQLIGLADTVLATQRPGAFGSLYVDKTRFSEFRAASLSFLKNLYGTDHPYYTDFESRVSAPDPPDTSKGKGILQAVKGELSGGWLRSARGIVAAELFADFLEMAQHLLAEGYKDAAAVMAGGVLEEHLRELCVAHGIPVTQSKNGADVPRKADALNADLAKANAYGKLDQKNVTAWLGLRNDAAHGHYNNYTAEQVSIMQNGILEFAARVSTT